MLNRRSFLITLGAVPVAAVVAGPAWAAKPRVFATNGIAINGYDPVAYFSENKPVAGDAAYTAEWNGATWQFASQANRDTFVAAPESYAPQYGGYCAYAVSKGGTATTQPDTWTIHEGKLYLNFNLTVRDIWRQDISGNVAKADANWPSVLEA